MKNPFLVVVVAFLILQFNSLHANKGSGTDQSYLKTSIKISTPNNKTVWTIPNTVEIAWDTKNIPLNKTIQFYLSKDDMVVQELGIFENSKFIDGIKLDRSLAAGDKYRVIGIELFPENKNSIAKFATAFFTIKKAPRETEVTTQTNEEQPKVRDFFDGRNINYVDELMVYGDSIKINLWDHGRADGDIVSIYLNGEAIVSKHRLTYLKKSFDIKLDATKRNDLFLYAHNLGKSPPNTVSIEIIDGAVSEQIILNSDLKSCEAVLIKVGR